MICADDIAQALPFRGSEILACGVRQSLRRKIKQGKAGQAVGNFVRIEGDVFGRVVSLQPAALNFSCGTGNDRCIFRYTDFQHWLVLSGKDVGPGTDRGDGFIGDKSSQPGDILMAGMKSGYGAVIFYAQV